MFLLTPRPPPSTLLPCPPLYSPVQLSAGASTGALTTRCLSLRSAAPTAPADRIVTSPMEIGRESRRQRAKTLAGAVRQKKKDGAAQGLPGHVRRIGVGAGDVGLA